MTLIIKSEAELSENYELAVSVMGVGPVIATDLIIKTGNFKTIDTARKAASYAGSSAVALEYALKHQNHISGLIITGTSFIGTQQESIDRRKEFEEKRAKESKWFAQVIANWDYMDEHKTNIDKNGNDISTSPIKWWCYDEESSQKVIPIVKEISNAGRRKPIDNRNYYETPTERQKYLDNQKEFSKIRAKTLIINGKYDTNNAPKHAEKLYHIIPNSELIIIDKAGHFPWIENSNETFNQMNIWLNKNQ
ncbi:hypothetical protein FQR65_LT14733 [Abscondita terminalis]|nr:hypothetical protein FQR65_LT14733 [Abscondita terminalis]